jgi:enediyne biosynthesis protein CalE5
MTLVTEGVFDPVRYKSGQKQQWDTAADGWRKWVPFLEDQWGGVNECLMDMAGIRKADRVLDVATGAGDPALSAARRVGPEGLVVATDHSPRMLALAEERATPAGIRNVKFRQMDAEALDLPLARFNAVVCRWGFMLLPDLPSSLIQIRRLLIIGGRLAAAIWDVPQNVPLLSLPLGIAQRMFQLPDSPPQAPSLFGLAGGVLEQRMARAGLGDIVSKRLTVSITFPSAQVFIEHLLDVNVPLVATLARQPADQQTAYWQGLTEALASYQESDGSIRIPNVTICVAGRRLA